jgi:hypothetical protein
MYPPNLFGIQNEGPGLLGPDPVMPNFNRAAQIVGSPPVAAQNPTLQDRVKNVLSRIGDAFSGPADPRLSAEQNDAARKQALFNAGIATILGGRGGNTTAQALAIGALTGQQAGASHRGGQVMNAQKEAAKKRLQDALGAGMVDEQSLRRMFTQALIAGDIDSARTLSEVLKSLPDPKAVTIDSGAYMVEAEGKNPTTGKMDRYTYDRRDPSKKHWHGVELPPKSATSALSLDLRKDNALFGRENALVDDYTRDTKDISEAYDFVHSALSNASLAIAGQAASKVNMLYAFVKAMDPASVVREGEIALVRGAAPLVSRVQNWIDDVARGKSPVVPKEVLIQMRDLMQKRMAFYEDRWSEQRGLMTDRAKRWEIDESAFRKAPERYKQYMPAVTGPNPKTSNLNRLLGK